MGPPRSERTASSMRCSRSSRRSSARRRAASCPCPGQASLFIEIAPGIAINQVTDAALKATTVQPALQIVERAYGLLELHDRDKGQVRGRATRSSRTWASTRHRLKPKILSTQIITGIEAYQSQLINRMRPGT